MWLDSTGYWHPPPFDNKSQVHLGCIFMSIESLTDRSTFFFVFEFGITINPNHWEGNVTLFVVTSGSEKSVFNFNFLSFNETYLDPIFICRLWRINRSFNISTMRIHSNITRFILY